jgi:hypothetical protein
VPIASRPEKARVPDSISRSSLLEVVNDLAFGHLPRHIEVARQPIFGRNHSEEIIDRLGADLV